MFDTVPASFLILLLLFRASCNFLVLETHFRKIVNSNSMKSEKRSFSHLTKSRIRTILILDIPESQSIEQTHTQRPIRRWVFWDSSWIKNHNQKYGELIFFSASTNDWLKLLSSWSACAGLGVYVCCDFMYASVVYWHAVWKNQTRARYRIPGTSQKHHTACMPF